MTVETLRHSAADGVVYELLCHSIDNDLLVQDDFCINSNEADVKGDSESHIGRIMNAEPDISDYEVKCCFGKGSNTSGPDGISSSMVDNSDSDLMHCCLKMLYSMKHGALVNS